MRTLLRRIASGRHLKLQALCFCLVLWCLGLFFYGLFTYPDAPYKWCGAWEYCGKRGSVIAQATFEDWKHWQGMLFASWPFGMLAGYGLKRLRRDLP
ncbi:MAG: hypothetical protein AB1437_13840 [Pseudomonadota bacterium]